MNYSKGRLRLRFGGLIFGRAYLFIYLFFVGGGGEARGRIIGILYTVETPLKDTSHKRTLPIKDTNLRSRQFLYYKSTFVTSLKRTPLVTERGDPFRGPKS